MYAAVPPLLPPITVAVSDLRVAALGAIVTVMVALLGAGVTVCGWFAVRRREDRQRGIERELKYRERQIEEFYGRLFSLMHHILIAEQVQQNFLKYIPDEERKIRVYFQEKYFRPLHNEMFQILETRLYVSFRRRCCAPRFQRLSQACM